MKTIEVMYHLKEYIKMRAATLEQQANEIKKSDIDKIDKMCRLATQTGRMDEFHELSQFTIKLYEEIEREQV